MQTCMHVQFLMRIRMNLLYFGSRTSASVLRRSKSSTFLKIWTSYWARTYSPRSTVLVEVKSVGRSTKNGELMRSIILQKTRIADYIRSSLHPKNGVVVTIFFLFLCPLIGRLFSHFFGFFRKPSKSFENNC